MPTKTTPKRKTSKRNVTTSHHVVPAHPPKKRFLWNWRMIILGLLLNAATFILVLISVSVLNDYKQCIANPNVVVVPSDDLPSRSSNTNSSTNSNTNTTPDENVNTDLPLNTNTSIELE